jgi:hypothetical protein
VPIDQTLRGLALEIDASNDPAPETQPLLEYRFINLANTQTILARIKSMPRPDRGGQLAFETNAGADTTTPRLLIMRKAMSASEPTTREPDWMSSAMRSSAGHYPFKGLSQQVASRKSVGI